MLCDILSFYNIFKVDDGLLGLELDDATKLNPYHSLFPPNFDDLQGRAGVGIGESERYKYRGWRWGREYDEQKLAVACNGEQADFVK